MIWERVMRRRQEEEQTEATFIHLLLQMITDRPVRSHNFMALESISLVEKMEENWVH